MHLKWPVPNLCCNTTIQQKVHNIPQQYIEPASLLALCAPESTDNCMLVQLIGPVKERYFGTVWYYTWQRCIWATRCQSERSLLILITCDPLMYTSIAQHTEMFTSWPLGNLVTPASRRSHVLVLSSWVSQPLSRQPQWVKQEINAVF